MKKKIILFAIVSLLTTGSIFATVYEYYIKCNNGTEHRGYMSSPDEDTAQDVLDALGEYYCG